MDEDDIRYYRVLKDTFLWNAGAVISNEEEGDAYKSINDLFDRLEHGEWISAGIILSDANSDFFERVWPMSLPATEEVEEPPIEFLTKPEAKEWQHGAYKTEQ